MCRRTDQRMDVMDHRIDILRWNQEIIHIQRDEPLIEFPEDPVYPPVPYASLTPTELAALVLSSPELLPPATTMMMKRWPMMMRRWRTMSSWSSPFYFFGSFPFLVS
jgi:hypothetical protein